MTLEAEFRERTPFLRALARRLCADRSADDLVQETYVAALTGAPRAQGLGPWLTTVVRNLAARRMRSDRRRRVREHAVAPSTTTIDTVDIAIKIDVARRLLQHVEALDAPLREAIFLRYYEDQKPQQIAKHLRVPLGTIKTRLARALTRLREQLDADHPEGRQNWLPALCVIGGMDPATHAVLVSNVAMVRRAPKIGHLLIAASAVLSATVVISSVLLEREGPRPTTTDSVSVATVSSDASSTPRIRREAVAATAGALLVQGLVEDADIGAEPGHGRPAANVTVRCKLAEPAAPAALRGKPPVAFETTTDAQGHFEIALPADTLPRSVIASGDEFLRAARWNVPQGKNGSEPARLVLTRYPHGQLQGIVAEPVGTPVAGARVTITHRQDDERVVVETSADQSGYFVLAARDTDSWLDAECEGFVQVGATEPRQLPRGGWEPARILLAPIGTLIVELVDRTGKPARDVRNVAVAMNAVEAGLIAATDCAQGPFRAVAPVAQGRATLTVPAGLQLALLAGETRFDREREGLGLTHASGEQAGQPIVVGAGEKRVLRLEISDIEVRGTVLDPNGQTVANAKIYFESLGSGRLESMLLAGTDARGQFDVHLSAPGDREDLLITALGSGSSTELSAQMWLRRDATLPAFVELRLERRPRLHGHVRGVGGEPVVARIRRTITPPSGGESLDGGEVSTDANGAFSFRNIVDVAQRLEVVSTEFETVVVDDVNPKKPVGVVLEQPKCARFRLLMNGSPSQVTDLEVRVGYFVATTGGTPSWPALGVTTTWSQAALIALPSHPVHHRIRRPEGTWRYEVHRRVPMVDDERGRFAELRLERGPATISVTARSAEGAPLSRLTTGPVNITGGEVELPLTLSPTATCRGRILFGEGTERFAACIGLADDAGRLLMISMLDRDDVWESIVAVSSQGHFALGSVPVGIWELRVGTRSELEQGAARARQRVVIAGDVVETIVVKL